MFVIYKATFKNGLFYIGMTSNLNVRKQDHKKRMRAGSTSHFSNAIRKYGFETIVWEIISTHETRDETELAEIEAIRKLKPHYNITAGGRSPTVVEETKNKIRKWHSGKIKSPQCRQNMVNARKLVLMEKGIAIKNKSAGEIFLERFNSGTLKPHVVKNLEKIKDNFKDGMTLNEIASIINVTQATIVKYQRLWLRKYIPDINHKPKIKFTKNLNKDRMWKIKRTNKMNVINNIRHLTTFDTVGKSVNRISSMSGLSYDVIQRLRRIWEGIIEEEGF